MKNKLFAALPAIILGALTAIAPQTFAHACAGHDVPGACHYSALAASGVGVVIALLGVAALFVGTRERIGLNIAVVANALLVLAIPTVLIGVCPGAMMHCRMVMLPTLMVLGALAIVFAAIALVMDAKSTNAAATRVR